MLPRSISSRSLPRARDVLLTVALVITGAKSLHWWRTRVPDSTPRAPAALETSPTPAGPALSSFAFTDQHGERIDNSSLRGHVWIADFMFTSCTSACPLLTSRLVLLERRLRDDSVRFVSFSVDPEHDTPAALAEYAAHWGQDEPRWHLLSTARPGLTALTSSLQLALEGSGTDIVHSDRFFLVDAQGSVVGRYDSSDDAALEQLVGATVRLLEQPAAAASMTGSGAQLFSALGCAGCHDNSQLAPPLGGLFGRHVMLERGAPLLADDDYARESIASPATKLVAGYPNSMPSYGSLLSGEQLTSLVLYLHSLPEAANAPAAASETDPVCGMTVRVTASTPTVETGGHSYHFCSPACAHRFAAEPGKYRHGSSNTER
jgi:protein SCO1/2